MALGSEQENLYQHRPRHIAPLPYSKPAVAYQPQTLANGGHSVVRRNARERNRVKQVNNGFTNLRQHIPVAVIADLSNGRRGIGPGANKKLSKVNTLRMAVEYIRRLQQLIVASDGPTAGQAQQSQQLLYQQQQQQQQLYALQQQLQLSSPSGCSNSSSSCSSSSSSNDAQMYYAQQSNTTTATTHTHSSSIGGAFHGLKLESSSYEDYPNNSCSSGGEDEDILDYISLWQDDL